MDEKASENVWPVQTRARKASCQLHGRAIAVSATWQRKSAESERTGRVIVEVVRSRHVGRGSGAFGRWTGRCDAMQVELCDKGKRVAGKPRGSDDWMRSSIADVRRLPV